MQLLCPKPVFDHKSNLIVSSSRLIVACIAVRRQTLHVCIESIVQTCVSTRQWPHLLDVAIVGPKACSHGCSHQIGVQVHTAQVRVSCVVTMHVGFAGYHVAWLELHL